MSGSFPANPAPASLKIRSMQPTLVSTAHSLQRQVRSRGGHRWMLSASWPALTRAQWAAFYGFAQAQRGQYGTFTYVLGGYLSSPQGAGTGTPLVKGASQSGRSVITDGWTALVTGILKAGDFIKFAGHAKVYMLTADVDSDYTGSATLAIEPALFATPADNEAITVNNVPFTVAFGSDTRETDVAPGKIFTFAADMIEVP